MLTKTTTLNSYQAALGVRKRMNAAMRACTSWAMLEEHDKILDMACVDGALLSALNDKMRLTLCGLCEQPEQARAVREMLDDADVISGRVDDIPWRSNSFDIVLLPTAVRGDVIRGAIQEAFRVLHEGGQFVMASSHVQMNDGGLNRREIMRVMQEAGFTAVSCRKNLMCGALVGFKPRKEKEEK
ncbi:MAG: class I SAM-dependent methyltransferase [Clostridia bacterium]|nr:class I SAM-dependent methyltransferase [Clostridia bacterium]